MAKRALYELTVLPDMPTAVAQFRPATGRSMPIAMDIHR